MSPRLLLLGNTGQVGWELQRALLPLGEIIALDYPQIDMTDCASIRHVVQQVKPQIILNATAYTNVDKAESEPDLAMAINGTGPGFLAEEALKAQAALVHYSTDFVFDGTKPDPYNEADTPNPINTYGRTKLAGEAAVTAVDCAYIIIRTSWVYTNRRPCFVTKVLDWGRKFETLRIVEDKIGSPTWARYLAESTTQIIAQGIQDPVGWIAEMRGIYHLAGGGGSTRYDWAKAILEHDPLKSEQICQSIQPAKQADFPTPAPRPPQTALSCTKAQQVFQLAIPPWEVTLRLMLTG